MQEAGRRARAPRPRRAPPTTSTATATARSRSAGRGGRAADRAATRPARACRPNCRSRRRPNRPLIRIAGSSASGLPVSVSKVPRPVLVLVPVSTGVVPMASLNVGTFGFGRFGADRVAEFHRLGVLGLGLGDRLLRHAAPVLLSSRNFTILSSAAMKLGHQPRTSPCGRPALSSPACTALALTCGGLTAAPGSACIAAAAHAARAPAARQAQRLPMPGRARWRGAIHR